MFGKKKSRNDGKVEYGKGDDVKSTTVNVEKVAQEPVDIETIARARAGLRWGMTPKARDPNAKNAPPGPDHPVHKIPLEKQEKMRKKGVNPVLWAEMNVNNHGEKKLWTKFLFMSSPGGISGVSAM